MVYMYIMNTSDMLYLAAFLNLTHTGVYRCRIIGYSGLSDNTYTDLNFCSWHFVTVHILGLHS